ncbi:MAG: thioesterase domain-containing protein [Myxococcota bacterium]|nr:thioesterase domain-containing protein [Myxococcota bacterium]
MAEFYTVHAEGDIPVEAELSDVIGFNTEGSQPPLFLVQTWKKETVNIQRLARHLGPDQPVFSVNPPRGETRDDFPRRDSNWSEYALERLDRLGHAGTWRIGGWSFGGTLSLGVAQRLLDRGEKVENVILFDAIFPGLSRSSRRNRKSHPIHRIASSISDYYDRPDQERKEALNRMLSGWKRRLVGTEEKWVADRKKRMDLLHRAIHVAYLNYQEFKFHGPVNLLWTDETFKKAQDLSLGWHPHLRGPFSSQRIAAGHVEMWHEPDIQRVASVTRSILG